MSEHKCFDCALADKSEDFPLCHTGIIQTADFDICSMFVLREPEVNPFDYYHSIEISEEYYFVKTELWMWDKTDGVDGIPFYDMDAGGRLFSSACDCPSCGGEDSLDICAGFDSSGNVSLVDCFCLKCNRDFEAVGKHGIGKLIKRDKKDDHHVILPAYIVLSTGY